MIPDCADAKGRAGGDGSGLSGLGGDQLAQAGEVGPLPLTHHFEMQRPPAEVALGRGMWLQAQPHPLPYGQQVLCEDRQFDKIQRNIRPREMKIYPTKNLSTNVHSSYFHNSQKVGT